jgi:RNA polymerase sigma factor (sigma-70 family)
MDQDRTTRGVEDDVSVLLHRCRQGHPQAWRSMVEQFTPVVWTVAKSWGLRPSDCEDVCQSTWAHVVKSIDTIQRPERLRTWVVTVAKRESIKYKRSAAHQVPVADIESDVREPDDSGPEDVVVARADHWRVHAALRQLPGPQQALVRLLLSEPALTYDEISTRLNIPRGSIGPVRNRVLRRMRRLLEQDHLPTPQRHIA